MRGRFELSNAIRSLFFVLRCEGRANTIAALQTLGFATLSVIRPTKPIVPFAAGAAIRGMVTILTENTDGEKRSFVLDGDRTDPLLRRAEHVVD